MKKIIMIIVLIILVAEIILGVNSCIKKKDDKAIPKIRTAVVQRGDMVVKVTETGSVNQKLL